MVSVVAVYFAMSENDLCLRRVSERLFQAIQDRKLKKNEVESGHSYVNNTLTISQSADNLLWYDIGFGNAHGGLVQDLNTVCTNIHSEVVKSNRSLEEVTQELYGSPDRLMVSMP